MKKIDLGQMISILANLGVIAGIVFLAIELRQNTLVTEVMVAEGYLAAVSRPAELVAANPQLADVIARAVSGESLTPGEELQLGNLYATRLRGWQNAYLQYERGVLREDLLRNYDETLGAFLADNPTYLDHWVDTKDRYTPSFVNHVESFLVGTDGPE